VIFLCLFVKIEIGISYDVFRRFFTKTIHLSFSSVLSIVVYRYLFRQGPRRRPGIDLKYLYYGFGYLQDMVEHAIIYLHTGTTSLGGSGPCWTGSRSASEK
jgi:hypothetical protein